MCYSNFSVIYLQVFFSFFQKLDFSGCFRGFKGQKTVWNDKKFCLPHLISQKPYIIWMSFMVHMRKMIISPDTLFIFSKYWLFVLLGGKRARNSPNDKKFCLLCSISQEPCIIWLSFMVHMWKMIIYSNDFFIFSKFSFFRLLGGKRAKKVQNDKKNSAHCTPYLWNHTLYDCYLWYTFVKL